MFRWNESTWRREATMPPLSEVYGSVRLPAGRSEWRRALAFIGPGYLVATGYMDPGNWATALGAGSKFGTTLLFVALLSSLTAMLLQALCARLAIATGRDLAQACRDSYPRPVAWALWVLAELAICATDLAEVIGTAIGLSLLFGIPLEIGVVITALDVFLILALQRLGFRAVEAAVAAMLGVIAVCFATQLLLARPDMAAVVAGLTPTSELIRSPEMLLLAISIMGATVMPHNLYLHSAVVLTRPRGDTVEERRKTLRYATLDSTLALTFALVINASILILAAAAFHANGKTEVEQLSKAHALLAPLLGSSLAPILFGVALLACGFSSTISATLAGQAVMEGFVEMRLAPWLRRLVTRGLAIIPAAAVAIVMGEAKTEQLLVASQVVLSFQLPFAMVPLILITANRKKMGELVARPWQIALASIAAVVIIALNIWLIVQSLTA